MYLKKKAIEYHNQYPSRSPLGFMKSGLFHLRADLKACSCFGRGHIHFGIFL